MAEHTYPEYLQLRKGETPPADPHEVGVRLYADTGGALRTIQSDGTDAAVGGGGGSSLANYAVIQINGGPGVGAAPPLSVADPIFFYELGDLVILEQSGDDFSLGEFNGHAAVLSAAGGLIQAGMIVYPQFADATIDPSNTDPRWVELGFTVGAGNSPMNTMGYDCSFLVGGGQKGNQTFAGLPGVVLPGGPALNGPFFAFMNPHGTDSVTLDFWDAEALVIWTLGALA